MGIRRKLTAWYWRNSETCDDCDQHTFRWRWALHDIHMPFWLRRHGERDTYRQLHYFSGGPGLSLGAFDQLLREQYAEPLRAALSYGALGGPFGGIRVLLDDRLPPNQLWMVDPNMVAKVDLTDPEAKVTFPFKGAHAKHVVYDEAAAAAWGPHFLEWCRSLGVEPSDLLYDYWLDTP